MGKENERKDIVFEPEGMVYVNPSKPLYERHHLCIYLRELEELAEDIFKEQTHKNEGGVLR